MVEYRRMIWQYRANRIAEITRILCVLLMCDEVSIALQYNFPLWDDLGMIATGILMRVAGFIDKHTRMYRFDL